MKRTKLLFAAIILITCLGLIFACDDDSETTEYEYGYLPELPASLPFEIVRSDTGTALTDEEITAFTKKITGTWKNTGFFEWLDDVMYGLDKSYDPDMPYYASIWDGVNSVKEGDLVTFVLQEGSSAENMMIKNSVLLMNIIGLYSATKDAEYADLINKIARGISATMMASVWNEDVAEEDRYVMARSVINHDHQWTTDSGKSAAVDYSAWRVYSTQWNVDKVNIPDNPYWGDIWIQNKRSKDDVCRLFRAGAYMAHFLDIWEDEETKEAVNMAYFDLKNFAKDIVKYGYQIRTVDHDGSLYIPEEDLASFIMYGDEAECNARLASQLFANDYNNNVDCGDGICEWYETAALTAHMWSYNLIRNFHMAALLFALNNTADETISDLAYDLLQGLIARLDGEMELVRTDYYGDEQEGYEKTLSGTLVGYATCGVPLTSEEIQLVHDYYETAAEQWDSWEYWDLWDSSIPDGEYSYKPGSDVRFEDMTAFLQLCASPYYNDNGRPVVDCEVILDPTRWGE